MFAEYTAHESTDAKCSFADKDDSNDFFKYKDGKKVVDNNRVYVCPTGTLDIMAKHVLDAQKLAEEKERVARKAKMAAALKKYPHIRPEIKKAVKQSCANTMNNGAVQMNQKYVSNVCDCLACIFDVTDGEEIAYSFIESGGKDKSAASMAAVITIDRYEDECRKYYYKERSSDPCKEVKALVKERIDTFGE